MNLVREELKKFRETQTLALLDVVELNETLGVNTFLLRSHSGSDRPLESMRKLIDALERVVQLVEEMERLEERIGVAARIAREAGRYDLSDSRRIYAARLRATRLAITQAMTAAFTEQ